MVKGHLLFLDFNDLENTVKVIECFSRPGKKEGVIIMVLKS